TAACLPGTPLVCNDGNGCTDDTCVPLVGCAFTPNVNGCDDANNCTSGDVCAAGACVGIPTVCVDTDLCNGTDARDPGTGACVSGPPPNCDDGDACTVDGCDALLGCTHVAIPSCLLNSLNRKFLAPIQQTVEASAPQAMCGQGQQKRLDRLIVQVRRDVAAA